MQGLRILNKDGGAPSSEEIEAAHRVANTYGPIKTGTFLQKDQVNDVEVEYFAYKRLAIVFSKKNTAEIGLIMKALGGALRPVTLKAVSSGEIDKNAIKELAEITYAHDGPHSELGGLLARNAEPVCNLNVVAVRNLGVALTTVLYISSYVDSQYDSFNVADMYRVSGSSYLLLEVGGANTFGETGDLSFIRYVDTNDLVTRYTPATTFVLSALNVNISIPVYASQEDADSATGSVGTLEVFVYMFMPAYTSFVNYVTSEIVVIPGSPDLSMVIRIATSVVNNGDGTYTVSFSASTFKYVVERVSTESLASGWGGIATPSVPAFEQIFPVYGNAGLLAVGITVTSSFVGSVSQFSYQYHGQRAYLTSSGPVVETEDIFTDLQGIGTSTRNASRTLSHLEYHIPSTPYYFYKNGATELYGSIKLDKVLDIVSPTKSDSESDELTDAYGMIATSYITDNSSFYTSAGYAITLGGYIENSSYRLYVSHRENELAGGYRFGHTKVEVRNLSNAIVDSYTSLEVQAPGASAVRYCVSAYPGFIGTLSVQPYPNIYNSYSDDLGGAYSRVIAAGFIKRVRFNGVNEQPRPYLFDHSSIGLAGVAAYIGDSLFAVRSASTGGEAMILIAYPYLLALTFLIGASEADITTAKTSIMDILNNEPLSAFVTDPYSFSNDPDTEDYLVVDISTRNTDLINVAAVFDVVASEVSNGSGVDEATLATLDAYILYFADGPQTADTAKDALIQKYIQRVYVGGCLIVS